MKTLQWTISKTFRSTGIANGNSPYIRRRHSTGRQVAHSAARGTLSVWIFYIIRSLFFLTAYFRSIQFSNVCFCFLKHNFHPHNCHRQLARFEFRFSFGLRFPYEWERKFYARLSLSTPCFKTCNSFETRWFTQLAEWRWPIKIPVSRPCVIQSDRIFKLSTNTFHLPNSVKLRRACDQRRVQDMEEEHAVPLRSGNDPRARMAKSHLAMAARCDQVSSATFQTVVTCCASTVHQFVHQSNHLTTLSSRQ